MLADIAHARRDKLDQYIDADPFWLVHGQMNHAYDERGKVESADYPAE